jgi:hypothetical protein
MDIRQYIDSVATKIDSLKTHFPRTTALEIEEYASIPSGVFKSYVHGTHERIGYVLDINYEYFEIQRNGGLHKVYRYRIRRGADELIRFQSARPPHSENAHFPPQFLSGANHFSIERWPAQLQDMNFHTIFALYLDVVRNDGELPEPFKSARP